MSRFTTHGRLKTLFNGEGFSFPSEQKDPFHFKFRSTQSCELKVRCTGSFSSYPSRKSNRCNAKALPSPTFSNGSVHVEDYPDRDDYEFVNDSLASFRGLVLDVSYRSLLQYLLYCLLFCISRIYFLNSIVLRTPVIKKDYSLFFFLSLIGFGEYHLVFLVPGFNWCLPYRGVIYLLLTSS